jgi:hypothetical protein
MKLNAENIKTIAEDLQTGMNIYINRETLEIRNVINLDDLYGDTEFWEEELEKIEKEWTDYIVIEKLESREAFRIMELFAEEAQDERFRSDLIKILQRRSPFANFKAEVESSEYRQQWFDFKTRQYIHYVKEQLEENEIGFEG